MKGTNITQSREQGQVVGFDKRAASTTELALAEIWREVLACAEVNADDNFFELGGHSLLATQVISRVRSTFESRVPVRALFEHPRLGDFAAAVDAALPVAQAADVTADNHSEPALSFAQERIWYSQQIAPDTKVFAVPLAWRLTGRLDVEALQAAIRALGARHEALRTVVETHDGEPRARLLPAPNLEVGWADFEQLSSTEVRAQLRLALDDLVAQLDMAQGPLMTAKICRTAHDEHVLLLAGHHVAFDGWSLSIIQGDLSEFYARSSAAAVDASPVQYSDFARWERRLLDGRALEEGMRHWREALDGAPAYSTLFGAAPSTTRSAEAGAQLGVALDATVITRLREIGARTGSSLFMTTLAAFSALVAVSSGQDEVVVGTPTAARGNREFDRVVGPLLNVLPLRLQCSAAEPFTTVLSRTRETALAALAHQHVPFDRIVEAVQPRRVPGRSPLCQILFAVHNVPDSELMLEGVTVDELTTPVDESQFEVSFGLQERRSGPLAILTYRAASYERDRITRFAAAFGQLLKKLAEDPTLPAYATAAKALADMERADEGALPLVHALKDWDPLDASLPTPEGEDALDAEGSAAAIIECWEELLGHAVDDRSADFFEAGGTSMLFVKMVASLTQRVSVSIDLAAALEDPTLAGLSRHIAERRQTV